MGDTHTEKQSKGRPSPPKSETLGDGDKTRPTGEMQMGQLFHRCRRRRTQSAYLGAKCKEPIEAYITPQLMRSLLDQ